MKNKAFNYFKILGLCGLLFMGISVSSCSSSDDPEPVETTDDTGVDPTDDTTDDTSDDTVDDTSLDLVTIVRGPNLYSGNNLIEPTQVRAVITDENNTVIVDQIIEANTTVTLGADYENTNPYSLHIIYRNRSGETTFNPKTGPED